MRSLRGWHRTAFIIAVVLVAISVGSSRPVCAAEVSVSYADWHFAEDIWNRSLQQAIGEFEKMYPGITVEKQPVALGQRDVKITTAIRAGKGPDVFALDATPVKQYIKEGWAKDLTPFIQKEGGAQWLGDFYPISLEPVTEQGRVYGIPKLASVMLLIYNSELYNSAGLKAPPTTWVEFRQMSKLLTRPAQPGGPIDQWAFTIPLGPGAMELRYSVILKSFGGDFLTPDLKHSALNTPEAREAFKFVVDLITEDKTVPPGVAQLDGGGSRRLFAQKKVAMILGQVADVPIIDDLNPSLTAWKVVGMTPTPMKGGINPKIRTTLVPHMLFMNPNTEHAEEAWKLITFLTDKKQMCKWFVDSKQGSPRKSVNNECDPIRQSPFMKIMVPEIERAGFMPMTPQWPEILETLRQAVQAAVAKIKTTDRAIADAHEQAERILARN